MCLLWSYKCWRLNKLFCSRPNTRGVWRDYECDSLSSAEVRDDRGGGQLREEEKDCTRLECGCAYLTTEQWTCCSMLEYTKWPYDVKYGRCVSSGCNSHITVDLSKCWLSYNEWMNDLTETDALLRFPFLSFGLFVIPSLFLICLCTVLMCVFHLSTVVTNISDHPFLSGSGLERMCISGGGWWRKTEQEREGGNYIV